MSIEDIQNSIRNVPDFPQKGIQFKDITTAIKQPQIFCEIINTLAQKLASQKIDRVVGIESRGFIFGASLAYKLGCGFIPVRKPNKLPATTMTQEYALEYGKDMLEIHTDALTNGMQVLIVDDLLATGGTAWATAQLVKRLGADVVAFAFAVELTDLHGAEKLTPFGTVISLVKY